MTYGLIEANTYGWGSPRIVGVFVVAAVSLVAFVLLERHQRAPMLDLSLFRNRTYVGANLVVLLVALAMFGVFFFVSLYMQNVLGFSAVEAGASFLPMTVLIILVAPWAGRLSDRWGSRGLMTAGMLLVTGQLVYFSMLGTEATFWTLLPGLLLGGFGMAMTMTPSAAAATRSVPVAKAGVGSAVLNAFRQVGGSIGIALMGAIMAAQLTDPPSVDSFMQGFEHSRSSLRGSPSQERRSPPGSSGHMTWRKVPTSGRPSPPRRCERGPPATRRLPAQERSPGHRHRGAAGLHVDELCRRDDGRDRARSRYHGAGPLSALRVEARPLARVS